MLVFLVIGSVGNVGDEVIFSMSARKKRIKITGYFSILIHISTDLRLGTRTTQDLNTCLKLGIRTTHPLGFTLMMVMNFILQSHRTKKVC